MPDRIKNEEVREVQSKLEVKDSLVQLIDGRKLTSDGGRTWVQLVGNNIVDQDGVLTDFKKGEYEVFIDTKPETVRIVGFLNVDRRGYGYFSPSEIDVDQQQKDDRDIVRVLPIDITITIDPVTRKPIEK